MSWGWEREGGLSCTGEAVLPQQEDLAKRRSLGKVVAAPRAPSQPWPGQPLLPPCRAAPLAQLHLLSKPSLRAAPSSPMPGTSGDHRAL